MHGPQKSGTFLFPVRGEIKSEDNVTGHHGLISHRKEGTWGEHLDGFRMGAGHRQGHHRSETWNFRPDRLLTWGRGAGARVRWCGH